MGFRTYDPSRWPNNAMVEHPKSGDGAMTGMSRFSPGELARRHEAVRELLRDRECELLIAQGAFPPTTAGSTVSLYWLSGYNGFRNPTTLILPTEGELQIYAGVKLTSRPGHHSPFVDGEDMAPVLRAAKRIAYYGTGLMTWQFHEYLRQVAPAAEIIDFSNELDHLIACKSDEELELMGDTCEIQDRVWRAAPTYLLPGRTFQEIRADVLRLLINLGMDPTLMPKILIGFLPNRSFDDRSSPHGMDLPRDTRVTESDFVSLILETPGSGGYYTERQRYFFFDEPADEVREYWSLAVQLHEFLCGAARPGSSVVEVQREFDEYKVSLGLDHVGMAAFRGIGMLTVDRPQARMPWEDIVLRPGHTLVTQIGARRDGLGMNLMETVVVRDSGAEMLGHYPLELGVL
ncbi:M24 family metallopeptidase [Microbacterium sp.]|uniref:M24 family metallopeptidase n=1 Tax=Microbacterium sp. TaxID=51671 RepID=UPI0039E464E4